jgi:hypothetical protein
MYPYTRDVSRILEKFDGLLAPQFNSYKPYVATFSRLEGLGLSAISFWDDSVDKRGGCNSIFFAPSLTILPAEFISEIRKRFPEVWNRLPNITFAASLLGETK